MKIKESRVKWEKFAVGQIGITYPQWPNEVIVKLAFGRYLRHRINFREGMKVLDVGCGFGNNLLPFLTKGCQGFGVEITDKMAKLARQILRQRGFNIPVQQGTNRQIPFRDNFFDVLLSVNVIHYEGTRKNVATAIKEYRRVLKPGGKLLLMTVAPKDTIIKTAKKVKEHVYKIQNFDFRDGTHFYCFETSKFLSASLNLQFTNVEVGRVTEQLMQIDLDFLIAAADAKM